MKILLDINDNKASFFMEMLQNFSFIKKVTTITESKANLMQDIKQAVEEVKLAKKGELDLQSLDEFLDEV